MRRWALAFAGLVVGLVAAEGLLRLGYRDLPSLVALRRSPYKSKRFLVTGRQAPDPSMNCYGAVSGRQDRDAVVGSGPVKRSLWAVGDSVTWGMGVLAQESYPHRLAEKIAVDSGATVTLENLALPGAGFCQTLRQLNTALDAAPPDVVLMGLFADDLESRAWLAFEGETIGLPDQIINLQLRWWARRSYLVNLSWFAIAPRTSGTTRLIDPPGQESFIRHVRAAADRVDAAGGQLIVALLPPAGLAQCPQDAPIKERCGWMREDLDLIARLLDEAGSDFIDLRQLWADGADHTLPAEREMGLAVHPNADGHARVAEAIWQQAGDRMR
jgi:lysophospholipase L1-like esterase